MNKILLVSILIILINANTIYASGSSYVDTLEFYISKSDCIVKAKIIKAYSPTCDGYGIVNYFCKIQILEIIKSDYKINDTNSIDVIISRLKTDSDIRKYLTFWVRPLKNLTRAINKPSAQGADIRISIKHNGILKGGSAPFARK